MVKNLPANTGELRRWFNPGVGKMPWRRKWQPIPVFLPGKHHREAWQATVQGVIKNWTQMSTHPPPLL